MHVRAARIKVIYILIGINFLLFCGLVFAVERVTVLQNRTAEDRKNFDLTVGNVVAAQRTGCERNNEVRSDIRLFLHVNIQIAEIIKKTAPNDEISGYFEGIEPQLIERLKSAAIAERDCASDFPLPPR